MWVYLIYLFFFLFASLVLYIVKRQSRIPVSSSINGARGLLLIAHPDDETMFFGPTILKVFYFKFKFTKVFFLSFLDNDVKSTFYVLVMATLMVLGNNENSSLLKLLVFWA